MQCKFCHRQFVQKHGNDKYCGDICRKTAQRLYMRSYQQRARGGGKSLYCLVKVKGRFFFVIPTRYKTLLEQSDGWYVFFEEGINLLIAKIMQKEGENALHRVGEQYRVYLEGTSCYRLRIPTTYQHWGVSFSATAEKITAVVRQRED